MLRFGSGKNNRNQMVTDAYQLQNILLKLKNKIVNWEHAE